MTWFEGDFNDDGVVNDKDAAILAAHWHAGMTESGSVPEPTTLVLLAGAVASMLLWRRARSDHFGDTETEPRIRI